MEELHHSNFGLNKPLVNDGVLSVFVDALPLYIEHYLRMLNLFYLELHYTFRRHLFRTISNFTIKRFQGAGTMDSAEKLAI